MRKITSILMLLIMCVGASWAQTTGTIAVSTNVDNPEHVYYMKNGNSRWMTQTTGPTVTLANRAQFAFFAGTRTGEGSETPYKIYCVTAQKWLSYTKAGSYENQTGFVTLVENQDAAESWVATTQDGKDAIGNVYQFAPYNNSGVALKYMNWYRGADANPNDNTNISVGLWQDDATADDGSCWVVVDAALDALVRNQTMVRLKNNSTGLYMTITSPNGTNQDNGGVDLGEKIVSTGAGCVNQVFYLKSPQNDGTCEIQTVSTKGYYLQSFATWGYKASAEKTSEASHIIEAVNDYYLLHTTKGYVGSNNGATTAGSHIYSNHGTDKTNIKWSFEALTETEVEQVTPVATYGSVDEWKNTQLSVLGYVGGYAKSERSNIESITDYAGIEAFVTGNHEVVEPVDGGYYFVQTAKNQTAGQGAYLSYTGTDCRVYSLGVGDKPGIQHVWQFNAPADGGFKLMSCNLGAYLQTGNAPAASTIAADMNNGFKYNFTINSEAEITIKDGNNNVLRTEGSNKGFIVNQWTNMNTDATWYIIPAEDIYVSLSAEDTKGAWATAHLPFGVNLPAENLKAYAVTATENNSATLTEVQNIPANQGVILNGTAGEHRLTINKDAAWDGVDNKLRGTNVNTSFSEAAYVLAKPETEVGLYKAAMTDGVWLNNANKAYLPANMVPNNAPALTFDFGTETGIGNIESTENAAGKAVIYDLSGRRVKGAQKGIFIINGKKVVK